MLVGVSAVAGGAPLALGAVVDWVWAPLAVITAVLLMVWGCARALDGPPAVPLARLRWPLTLLAMAIAWAGFQLATWAPEALHHPLWAEAERLTGLATPGRISLEPAATRAGIVRLSTYAVVGFLVVQLARQRQQAAVLVAVVAAGAAANAAFGLVEVFTPAHLLQAIPDQAWVTGVFVNRNHFATHVGLGLLATVTLAARPLGHALADRRGRRTRALGTAHAIFGPIGFLWAACALLGMALLLSVSRAGVSATIAGLVVLVLAMATGGRLKPRHATAAVTVCLASVTVFVTLVGADAAARFSHSVDQFEGRATAYAATLRAIADAPLMGTGLGTFRDVFEAYQPADLPKTWHHAHNTYLENALELGIPAALLLTLAPGVAAIRCWRGLRARRRDRQYPALGVAATVLVGLHATLDFSMELPGVALTYTVLLGVGLAQSWSTRPQPMDGSGATNIGTMR